MVVPASPPSPLPSSLKQALGLRLKTYEAPESRGSEQSLVANVVTQRPRAIYERHAPCTRAHSSTGLRPAASAASAASSSSAAAAAASVR
ncbi:hypothetical protein JOB18_024310 [Solea senegalensis]|uniref:Uncharacterized protein n=1 Tax=Solea senegalensis TaxID=28829 RepID=A0AAV6P921_SOLSE|nr:hypothetical protein JOB18_024310 [Solea senegalensis]